MPSLQGETSDDTFDPLLLRKGSSNTAFNIGSGFKIFMLEPGPLENYFQRLDGLRVIEIKPDGEARRMRFEDGSLVVVQE